MGIQNLLKFLASSTRDAHISEFENEFVAIDAYCWLHKGIYSCAFELAMKKPTAKYVTYCMRYIEMLLHFKVKPILVFDGRQLSSKSETEKKRREERKRKYEKGKELMRAGKTTDGRKLLAESVDVTHELALNLMKECRKKNIDCIVAPFEADAQLAFFSLNKIVKCVITEDSDLLVYGCERVMFKMDTSGRGKLVEKSEIHFSLNMTPEEYSEELFRYMCILTGCDYLPSLPSIGPVFALKFIKMLKGNNIYDALPKLPVYTNKMNIKVTNEYIAGFKIADNTFKHQLVYDPFLRMQIPLTPAKNDDDIVGTKLPEDLAYDLAVGNIDPNSMKKVDNFDPVKSGTGFSILWKKTSPSNTITREDYIYSSQDIIEPKKRQRESLEADAVQSITNDLKKHCIPPTGRSIKGFSATSAIQTIPKSGFVFAPKELNQKKNVPNSKKNNEISLLSSRYFSRELNNRRDNKPNENTNDRLKDESYEDYLQRLYDEYFPIGENRETKEENENGVAEELCVSCKMSPTSCRCIYKNDEVSDTQKLNECLRNIKEFKESRQKCNQHFLLDEIQKSQLENEELVKKDEIKVENETDVNNTPTRTFSVNLSNMLSKFDDLETDKTEVVEKENSEIVCDGEILSVKGEEQEPERSPSPVFKVQKETKVLKRNFRFGNIADTASTPVSVYFSSSQSSNEVSPRQTPSSSQRRIPLGLGSRSVPAKSGKNLKNSSVNKTLFQFGFKKQRRSDHELET